MTCFSDFGLIEPLLRAVSEQGYETPTPIQAQAIPPLLEKRDVLGIAQTGTGKTAAFALPLLQHLTEETRRPGPTRMRALILTPTRELALQIDSDLAAYGKYLPHRRAAIFGGVGQFPQVKALLRGLECVVATPGRLLDLMNQGHLSVAGVEILVLDEADRMLDMGFIHDIRRIVALLPQQRQTLLFSATMPPDIEALAARLLNNPARVEVTPAASTVERITQKVLFVHTAFKRRLLVEILGTPEVSRAIVFTRTKHGANKVSDHLEKAGIPAAAIHGNKSQGARQKALDAFRAGSVQTLVATDIAARGIDIDGISHVINFDLPNEPESYVHRIGRTARAGADGVALSFCSLEELPYLRAIEKTTRRDIPGFSDHGFHADDVAGLRWGGGSRKSNRPRPTEAKRRSSPLPSSPAPKEARRTPAVDAAARRNGDAPQPRLIKSPSVPTLTAEKEQRPKPPHRRKKQTGKPRNASRFAAGKKDR